MRLDKYLLKEMVVPFCIGTLVIVMMFQANAYIYVAKSFNVENIPLIARFQWIMYETPSYLEMTLPIGMSLASALMMTRLTRESELTALRASGVRILRVIAPIVVVGMLVGVLNFYIVDEVMPVSLHKAHELERKNEYLGLIPQFRNNAFLELGQFAASLGTVTRDHDGLVIHDILLIDRSDPTATVMITAKSGRYDRGVWNFKGGVLYRMQNGDIFSAEARDQFVIDQQIGIDQVLNSQDASSVEEQPTDQLRKAIASAKAMHADPRPAEVELQERYAVPASCAIFAITSPVFAVFFARSGGFVGILVSFFIVLLYYNAFVISTQILGKVETVPPWLAAWLPNILFGVLGVIAIRRLE